MIFFRVMAVLFLISTSFSFSGDGRVNMKNIEEFKSRFSSELTTGSSKEDAESYLEGMNIEHSYVASEKKIYAIVRKIGRFRIIYETNLLIRIQLDESEKVKYIEYEVEHSGL